MKNTILSKLSIFSIVTSILLYFLISCQVADFKKVAAIKTQDITQLASISAVANATLVDVGQGISDHGFCWNLTGSPSVNDSKIANGSKSDAGPFSNPISNLKPGTKYYLKAWANSEASVIYGASIEFTTLAILATLTTSAISSITASSGLSGGNISSDGGGSVTARGICWGTSPNPTISNSKTSDGSGTGSFTSSISGLSPGIMYYVRAYATNSAGTSYGNQLTLTTSITLPSISTSTLSSVSYTTCTGGGSILSDGGATVTSRGVCWSTSQNPTTVNSKTTDGTGIGSFTSLITGLAPGTTYYFRAYAINNAGIAYGSQVSTTSLSLSTAIITTNSITSITLNSAVSGGNISNDGGATVTARGVCWSTLSDPTTSNFKTTDGTGTGSFTSFLTALSSGTTYYVRAYSINSAGISYGNQFSLTTSTTLPSVSTTTLSSVSYSAAMGGGVISSDGGAIITSRGVCWSTSQNPTTANSRTIDGAGIGSFTSSITGLSPGTTYYFRAYAINNVGTSYGTQVSATTTSLGLPSVTTTSITSTTPSSAISGGNISSDGGVTVTARGVCWSNSQNPTTSNSKTSDGSGTGSYNSSITGLNPGTTYYIRAYATNAYGTSYGNQLVFFTSILSPTVSTSAISSITYTSFIGGGNISSDGGSAVTSRGVCWNTWQNPTIYDNITSDGSGIGIFSSSYNGLTPGTTYYFRAYAINSAGISYGSQITATTPAAVLVTVSTTSITSITSTSGISGGNITSDGGRPVTARGVCWSTSPSPTIANSKTTDGTGTGSFTSSITGLYSGTLYYVRAYSTNSVGTSYGSQLALTTTIGIPSVATSSISSVSYTTCSGGGNVTSSGGANVTSRGVCWSTSQNPTTANSKTLDGTGIGSFVSSITGLTPGATYYVRAYAINSAGTAYGSQETVTTIPLSAPVLTTTSITSITTSSASSGGNVTSDGGATVSARGVCWSLTANPTVSNSKTTNGTGTGSFSSSITGLTTKKTYYVRAYATNSQGTSYGNSVTFTTY